MIKVELVTVDDAKELLNIYKPYVEKTAISFEYDVPSEEEFKKRIENTLKKYPYLKAIKDGEIIGYAYANCFKARKAYDRSIETTIYIKKDCKRSGAGRALYNELERRLKLMGILNMNACIACPIEENEYVNNDSYEFHKKMGYSLVGKFHNSGYKFNTWFDMIWMEKLIGDHKNVTEEVGFGNY